MKKLKNPNLRQKTLEAIHDSAVDAIITISEVGIIETVNHATETLFGYSAQELLGNNINLLMPKPYKENHDGYLRQYLTTGEAKIIGVGREVYARRKDGTIFPIHLAVSEVRVGDHRVFAGFIRDLTDLRQVEEQRAMLGRIIEDSLNEVYIFDAQTLKFLQVNRGARENLGYSEDELTELTPIDIKPDFTAEKFHGLLRPLLNGKIDKLDFSTIHRRKDGSTYDVDINVQVSTYLAHPVFVGIALDVTERRKAERQVRQQRESMQAELERLVETRTEELRLAQAELVLSEKFSTLGKVSGGIAHEIRNPLNAVKTSAYYLLNANNLSPAKVQEHLERIDRQVTMIDNVITALSDVAKLPEAFLRPVEMEPLLRNVVGSVNLPPEIKVVFDLPQPLPTVLADENQIAIAFRNLVRNGRDAMPDGGTLTLSATVDNSLVKFDVTDTGIGISEELIQSIIEPLFTTKARGLGLGLSITLAIVEKNQGVLSYTSKKGHGSVFSVGLNRHIPEPINKSPF